MKRIYLKAALLLFFICIFLTAYYLKLFHYLELSQLKLIQSEGMKIYNENPIRTSVLYFFIYFIISATSLPLATGLTLLGAFIFGFWYSLFIISFASSFGATVSFLSSRFIFKEFIESKFKSQLEVINKGLEEEGAYYLFMMRVFPAMPFFLINILMGVTRFKVRDFYIFSQLGMLPGTIIYINAGTQLSQIQKIQDIYSINIVASFIIIAIFPYAVKKILSLIKKSSKNELPK